MSITDWNAWMQKHGIYIPTEKEAREAKEQGRIKVKPKKGAIENEGNS